MALAPVTRQPEASSTGAWPASRWGGQFTAWRERAAGVPWLWPALLTFVLGCYHLGRPELWRDELWSWTFASEPVHTLLAKVSVFNPAQLAYELGLHYWIAVFGDSVRSMRAPSVLAMAATAAIVTLLGRRLAGPRAGLLGGLVFALVPSVSRFAQEARFYAPQLLAVALASLMLARAFDRPAVHRWAAYAACVALVGYTDIVALAVLAAHAVWAGLRWQEGRDARVLWFAPAAGAGIAGCAPILSGCVSDAANQVGWLTRPGVDVPEVSGFTWNLFYSAPVAAAVIVLGLLAWTAWRPAAVAGSLAVVPVLAVWVISQGPDSYFFPRYLLYTLAGWAILTGIALSRIHWPQAAACVLAIAVLGASDQQTIRQAGAHNWATYPAGAASGFYFDYAGLASAIDEHARPGDGLWYPVNQWLLIGPGLRYYLSRELPPGRPLPRQVTPANPEPRVWVVAGGYGSDPFRKMPRSYARALRHYTVARIWRRRGLTVFLITRRY